MSMRNLLSALLLACGLAFTAIAAEQVDKPGHLGITVFETDPTTSQGVMVKEVFRGTTAAELGLVKGDLITDFAGEGVRTKEQLQAAIKQVGIGDEFKLTIKRGGKVKVLAGTMRGTPAMGEVINRIRNQQQLVRERERLRDELLKSKEEVSLADAMQQLARALEEFPAKLQAASEQFKQVYPKGKFTIRIEIDIQSDAEAEQVIDLSPDDLAPEEEDEAAAGDPAPDPEPEPEAEPDAGP